MRRTALSDWPVRQRTVNGGQSLAPRYEADRRSGGGGGPFHKSGMRIGGSLIWLHVAAAGTAVRHTAHPKRGRDAMDAAGILPEFQGIAVHGHRKPCRAYKRCAHALCNAHHLRNHKAQALRFLTDWRVPFDNNLAERLVRPVK